MLKVLFIIKETKLNNYHNTPTSKERKPRMMISNTHVNPKLKKARVTCLTKLDPIYNDKTNAFKIIRISIRLLTEM